jgi:hypothetical protein
MNGARDRDVLKPVPVHDVGPKRIPDSDYAPERHEQRQRYQGGSIPIFPVGGMHSLRYTPRDRNHAAA